MKKIVAGLVVVFGCIGFGLYLHYTPLADRCEYSHSCKQEIVRPSYLYKIIPVEDWNASKDQVSIKLSAIDDNFIHLAMYEQLDKIITKFWSQAPEVVVLKLSVTQLSGDLKFERNPGGDNKYYHLYNGSIPRSAVIAVEMRKV